MDKRLHGFYIVIFIFLIWAFELTEYTTGVKLAIWGLYPREVSGLVGIITSPFLHGDWFHLMSNTFSFLLFAFALSFFYPNIFFRVVLHSFWITGVGVWLLARPSYHIGASGVIYAYAGFLFFSGAFRKEFQAVIISAIILFVFTGLIEGLFPVTEGVSWESHLIGFFGGGALAFAYRHRPSGTEVQESRSFRERDIDYQKGFKKLENRYFKYEYKETEK